MTTVTTSAEATILTGAWRALGAEPIEPAQLTICGPEAVLPSVFDVTALAAASVALANVAAAELLAARDRRCGPTRHRGSPAGIGGVPQRGALRT